MSKIKLIVTEQNIGLLVATYIKQRINTFNPTFTKPFVIGFPTGSTPLDMYKYLVEFYKNGELSFKNVISFNLDEYVNLDVNHPESYHSYMRKNLFDHIDIPAENINIPNGNAADLQAACRAYDEKIKSCGGIELFLGGVGRNGHIAFNEPGSPFDSPTRVVTLNENTISANARFFNNDVNAVPKQAISMGLGTIMAAREVIIMTTGVKKADAVYQAIEGKRDIKCSITVLQEHPNAYIVSDRDAASLLSTSACMKCGVCSFM